MCSCLTDSERNVEVTHTQRKFYTCIEFGAVWCCSRVSNDTKNEKKISSDFTFLYHPTLYIPIGAGTGTGVF